MVAMADMAAVEGMAPTVEAPVGLAAAVVGLHPATLAVRAAHSLAAAVQ